MIFHHNSFNSNNFYFELMIGIKGSGRMDRTTVFYSDFKFHISIFYDDDYTCYGITRIRHSNCSNWTKGTKNIMCYKNDEVTKLITEL